MDASWAQVIVLIVATIIAFYAIRKARQTENQKETLAFFRGYATEERLDRASRVLKQGTGYEQLTSVQRVELAYLFNTFEYLAVGCKHKIYDKKMTRDFLGLEILEIYKLSKPYIEKSREKHGKPKSWAAFEEFAKSMDTRRQAARARKPGSGCRP